MDWSLMSDCKHLRITAAVFTFLFFSSAVRASDVGYYAFGQARYYGPKMDVGRIPDGLENNRTSAKRFYNTLAKRQINYFKNTGRTFKEAMSYGDWDKPYRVMTGFEYDFRQSKTSGSSYGYNDKSGTYFLLADKALSGSWWRFGAGLSFTHYDGSYDNAQHQDYNNYLGMLYAVYNDTERGTRLRSRFFLGYGTSDFRRLAEINDEEEVFRGSFDSWYYGFEHSLCQTFSHNGFYVQPTLEFNGRGVKRDEINEDGAVSYALQTKDRSYFMLDGLAGLYAGYKGTDWFGNKYNFKFGPDITYIFSDPYGQFELSDAAGNDIFMKKRPDYRNYVAWKAYFNYWFKNGAGIYSDARYYNKDKDSLSFALGLNYAF